MIKLKKIVRNNTHIVCDAYVEDCKERISLAFNEKTGQFEHYDLPIGYEWCDSHIAHAARYLETLIGKEIKDDSRMIMWY